MGFLFAARQAPVSREPVIAAGIATNVLRLAMIESAVSRGQAR